MYTIIIIYVIQDITIPRSFCILILFKWIEMSRVYINQSTTCLLNGLKWIMYLKICLLSMLFVSCCVNLLNKQIILGVSKILIKSLNRSCLSWLIENPYLNAAEHEHKPLDNLSCQWPVVQPSSNGFRFIYETQPEVQQVLRRPASFSVHTRPKYE